MIHPGEFCATLEETGVTFYTGVPDSLLKSFCSWVMEHIGGHRHIIAANEGGAVALAAGHHLATGQCALVYMQNSGIGNAINPLASLADSAVYSIPMVLMIGWRGEPGHHDEPQHAKQGRITLGLLDTLEIPYVTLSADDDSWRDRVLAICGAMREQRRPVAVVVRSKAFVTYPVEVDAQRDYPLTREDALSIILEVAEDKAVVVSTTGMASRELFELREAYQQGHDKDFLTVGSMGHCNQIALGIAVRKPWQQVLCLDGDGAVLMHMGGLAVVGQMKPRNFKHIVINNEAHDSVGGQPTASGNVDYVQLARSVGYDHAVRAATADELREAVEELMQNRGPALLEVRVRRGARANLGRPTTTPTDNKNSFMKRLMR